MSDGEEVEHIQFVPRFGRAKVPKLLKTVLDPGTVELPEHFAATNMPTESAPEKATRLFVTFPTSVYSPPFHLVRSTLCVDSKTPSS